MTGAVMSAVKLKWWMLDRGKTLFAVGEDSEAFSGIGAKASRGVVLEDAAAMRAFSYKCYWQLFVEFLPIAHWDGVQGNCRMILERDFGHEKIDEIIEFLEENLRNSPGIHVSENICCIDNIGFGQSVSGSRGRIVAHDGGADLTLS